MISFLSKIIVSLALIKSCQTVCRPPVLPPNAIISGYCIGAQRTGSVCQIQCMSGYIRQGSAVRVCQRNGLWSGLVVRCVPQYINCVPIRELENGVVVNSCTNRFVMGCRLTFSCNTGFKLNGSRVDQCLRGGQWSHPKPKCEQKVAPNCPTLPAPLGGYWVNKQSYYECNGQPGEMCGLECRSDFALVGPTYVYCDQKSHVWSKPIPTCIRQ